MTENSPGSAPILLFGGTGQVGTELAKYLCPLGDLIMPQRADVDLSDPDALKRCVFTVEPSLIINAAAYTAVDAAEQDSETALAVNATAPGVMAEEAKRLGIPLIHYSTDYVFDGQPADGPSAAARPYRESDRPKPLNVYGKSKLDGEKAIEAVAPVHLILRTSWVYSTHGKNFFLTIRRLASERTELRIVDDQFGSPTYAGSIAQVTTEIIRKSLSERPAASGPTLFETSGCYHLSAAGQTSWYGFAQAIVAKEQDAGNAERTAVRGIPSVEYPLPAKRPAYSVLDNSLLQTTFGITMTPWQDQLRQCFGE